MCNHDEEDGADTTAFIDLENLTGDELAFVLANVTPDPAARTKYLGINIDFLFERNSKRIPQHLLVLLALTARSGHSMLYVQLPKLTETTSTTFRPRTLH